MEILVLCTANQCRSPMAQVLLGEQLQARGIASSVSSAGFRTGGRPAAAHAQVTVAERGLSLAGHVSRAVTPALLEAADLVVTMERRHVQKAVLLESRCWPVCFSLGDLLVRGQEVGPRWDGEAVGGWVNRLHADRQPADVVGASIGGDVADPIGQPLRRFRATAKSLATACDTLADLLAPGPTPVVASPLPTGWRGHWSTRRSAPPR